MIEICHSWVHTAHNCTPMPTAALIITALVSIYRLMDRVNSVWMLNGVSFSPKEERSHITCSNVCSMYLKTMC